MNNYEDKYEETVKYELEHEDKIGIGLCKYVYICITTTMNYEHQIMFLKDVSCIRSMHITAYCINIAIEV